MAMMKLAMGQAMDFKHSMRQVGESLIVLGKNIPFVGNYITRLGRSFGESNETLEVMRKSMMNLRNVMFDVIKRSGKLIGLMAKLGYQLITFQGTEAMSETLSQMGVQLSAISDNFAGLGRSVNMMMTKMAVRSRTALSSMMSWIPGSAWISSALTSLASTFGLTGMSAYSSGLLAFQGWVLATAGIALIIPLVLALWDVFSSFFYSLDDFFSGFISGIREGFAPLKEAISEIGETISIFAEKLGIASKKGSSMATVMENVGHTIGQALGYASNILSPFIKIFNGLLKLVFSLGLAIWDTLVDPFLALGDEFSNLFSSFDKLINEIFGSDNQQKMSSWESIVLALSSSLRMLLGWVVEPLLDMFVFLLEVVISLVSWLVKLAQVLASLPIISWFVGDNSNGGMFPSTRNQLATQARWENGRNQNQGQPALAEGGIATRPTSAFIAEEGAEAVIPLDKLESFIDSGQGGTQTVHTTVELNGREIAEAVSEVKHEDKKREEGSSFDSPTG
jgi:hypothetical protein